MPKFEVTFINRVSNWVHSKHVVTAESHDAAETTARKEFTDVNPYDDSPFSTSVVQTDSSEPGSTPAEEFPAAEDGA